MDRHARVVVEHTCECVVPDELPMFGVPESRLRSCQGSNHKATEGEQISHPTFQPYLSTTTGKGSKLRCMCSGVQYQSKQKQYVIMMHWMVCGIRPPQHKTHALKFAALHSDVAFILKPFVDALQSTVSTLTFDLILQEKRCNFAINLIRLDVERTMDL